MRRSLLLSTAVLLWAGMLLTQPPPPALYYSDLTSGPKTGGENNEGALVCVFGRNFGSTQGDSTITVGGGLVGTMKVWQDEGPTSKRPAPAKACFALGANAASGNIVVTVGGQASNGLPFTVRATGTQPDGIWYLSTTGSNTNNGHATTNGQTPAGTGPKRTWAAIKAAGFQGGDIVYSLDATQTGSEGAPGFGATWYAFTHIASCTPAMPCTFAGYPYQDHLVMLGDKFTSNPIIRMGLVGAGIQNWVFANLGVACTIAAHYPCLGTTAPFATGGSVVASTANWFKNLRFVDLYFTAPAASTGWTGIMATGYVDGQVTYGLEFHNVGCGFGRHVREDGSLYPDDGSTTPNQTEQYACPVAALNGTVTAVGTNITINGGSGMPSVGDHLCVPDCTDPTNEKMITSVTSTTTGTIDSAWAADPTAAPAKLITHVATKFAHAMYPGVTYNWDNGWNWFHGVSMYNSVSYNTNNPNGAPQIASMTPNSEPVTGAALVTLTTSCEDALVGASKRMVACLTGDAVDIVSEHGASTSTGHDPTLIGSWYAKMVTPSSFYVYADKALTTPVTGSQSCASSCGWINQYTLQGWNFDHHHNRFDNVNHYAITVSGNAERGPILIHDNIFGSVGQGPTMFGNFGTPGGTSIITAAAYVDAGRQGGTFKIYNNTFYDNGGIKGTDLPFNYMTSITWGAIVNTATISIDSPNTIQPTLQVDNNLFYNLSPTNYYISTSSPSYFTGSGNIFYGGNASGAHPVPSSLLASAISCPAPCALFNDASTVDLHLASGTTPASSGGITTSSTKDFDGLFRPQGDTYSIGAYEYPSGGPAPVPPVITSLSPLPSGTVGTAYSYTFAGTGTPITWTATGVPTGMQLSTAGVLDCVSATCATVTAGTYTINVTATNGGGSDGPHEFSITFAPAPPVPEAGGGSKFSGKLTGGLGK